MNNPIDWVTFFQQNPFLLNWTAIQFWWIWIWSTAVSFIVAFPLMHPFGYMMNRMDNYNFGESEYWWSEKTFREVYPTYRSYVITWSLRNQIYFVTKMLPYHLTTLLYYTRVFKYKVHISSLKFNKLLDNELRYRLS
mgnify:CR=1 FL=1